MLASKSYIQPEKEEQFMIVLTLIALTIVQTFLSMSIKITHVDFLYIKKVEKDAVVTLL